MTAYEYLRKTEHHRRVESARVASRYQWVSTSFHSFKLSLAAVGITDEKDFKNVVHVGDSDVNDITVHKTSALAMPLNGAAKKLRFPSVWSKLADEMIASSYAFGDAQSTRRYF